jgi:hypothetical protein
MLDPGTIVHLNYKISSSFVRSLGFLYFVCTSGDNLQRLSPLTNHLVFQNPIYVLISHFYFVDCFAGKLQLKLSTRKDVSL